MVIDTSMGRITCQFYQRQAPHAVANFIAVAEGTRDWIDPATKKVQPRKPLYNGTIFHRVIPEFMIQGGDPTGTGRGDPGYIFAGTKDRADHRETVDFRSATSRCSRASFLTSDSMRSDYRRTESGQVPLLKRNQDAKQIR